jgi:starch-binding outer membrane protein SusE/F
MKKHNTAMNTLRYFTWIMLLAAFVQACDNEESLNLNLTEVKTLYTPEDNLSITLQPAQNMSETFQWDKAYAEDGSLVIYEVAFDQESGDFSQPFYRIVSDGKGVETKLTLTHADLNQIAKLGGADFFEKKKFKWTVMASKGNHIVPAAMSRAIELERPGGFDVLPGTLYITGTATEGGADIASAKIFKQTEPGKFEIYTSLTEGTYKFVDGLTGSARTFFINESTGAKVIGTDSENTFSGEDKVYRIRFDFNSLGVQVDEVKSVGFWYCWEDKIMWDLGYAGDGVWRVDNVTVNLSTVPWGLEERHKYKMVLNDGADDKEEWWGYISNDSPGQDGTYGTAAPEYFYAYKIASNDQWNYAWKLDRPAIQGKQADFILSFNGGEPYRMNYIIH